MPNIKSAIKRVKVTEKKNLENKMFKSKIATYVKKFKTAATNKDFENAEKLYNEVVSLLDKAVAKNVIHLNCASRRKANYAKFLADARN